MQSATKLVQAYAPQPAEGGSSSAGVTILLTIFAGVLLPAILAYGFVTTNEAQVAAAVVGMAAVLVVMARPLWGLLFFVGLLYVRPEEAIPALAGTRLVLSVSI